MLNQYRLLLIVWVLQALEMGSYYMFVWLGSTPANATSTGVATIAMFAILFTGLNNSTVREQKAHSKTGASRISLAADLLLWCGFGTLIATGFLRVSGDNPTSLILFDVIRVLLGVVLIAGSVVFSARALAAEVVYTSRKYPPGILYVPFLAVAIVLPAMLGLLPLWAVAAFLVFQLILVLVLTISPWSPVKTQRSP